MNTTPVHNLPACLELAYLLPSTISNPMRSQPRQSRTGRQTVDLKDASKCAPTEAKPSCPPPLKHGLSTTPTVSWRGTPLRSQPSFSCITQRWLTSHSSGSVYRQISNLFHSTSSINCKVSAMWGSVPQGARKWKQKKTQQHAN